MKNHVVNLSKDSERWRRAHLVFVWIEKKGKEPEENGLIVLFHEPFKNHF